MDDLTAYHLISGVARRRDVKEVSLAKNPLLGFAFFSQLVDLLEIC
jgi:hypothetical protein